MNEVQFWYYLAAGGVQFLAFLISGFAFAVRVTRVAAEQSAQIASNITALQKDVIVLEAEIRKLADVIILQTQQSARLDEVFRRTERLERWYDDLRRGKGFINDKGG